MAFHVSRAYSAQGVEPVSNRIVTTPVQPVGRIGSSGGAGSSQAADARRDPSIRKLIGAMVPGGVDFSGEAPTASRSRESLSLYSHPAAKNAAATGVTLGRSIDVSG